jgi:hypothetical protein
MVTRLISDVFHTEKYKYIMRISTYIKCLFIFGTCKLFFLDQYLSVHKVLKICSEFMHLYCVPSKIVTSEVIPINICPNN